MTGLMDWLAEWWPILLPTMVFLMGAAFAFKWLEDEMNDEDDDPITETKSNWDSQPDGMN